MEKTVIVTREFRDRDSFALVHSVGDLMTVDEGRANELIALGLVKERAEEADKPEAEASAPTPAIKRRRKAS